MSLCLADVLMGLAGAGGIAFTQFSLLGGSLKIGEFLGDQTFTENFENPEAAQNSGLNQLFFITQRPGLVICGALVRYR